MATRSALTYFDMALLQSRDNLRQVICLNAILNSSARSETEAMHEVGLMAER